MSAKEYNNDAPENQVVEISDAVIARMKSDARKKKEDRLSFTRRTLLAGAASLLMPTLPGFSNVFVLPGATEAYGAETSTADTEVVIVRPGYVTLSVFDTSTAKKKLLKNAKVSIYSYYNTKTLEGTVDESTGTVSFDIRKEEEMVDPDTGKTVRRSYAQPQLTTGISEYDDYYFFEGDITVTCEGYRDVFLPCVTIMDRSGYALPTRPADGKTAYLRSVAFDNQDIQYQTIEFLSNEKNDADHELSVTAYLPAGESFTVTPYATDSNTGEKKAVAKAQDVVNNGGGAKIETVTFTGKFLCCGDEAAFPADSAISVELESKSDSSVKATLSTGLKIETSPLQLELESCEKNTNIVSLFGLATNAAAQSADGVSALSGGVSDELSDFGDKFSVGTKPSFSVTLNNKFIPSLDFSFALWDVPFTLAFNPVNSTISFSLKLMEAGGQYRAGRLVPDQVQDTDEHGVGKVDGNGDPIMIDNPDKRTWKSKYKSLNGFGGDSFSPYNVGKFDWDDFEKNWNFYKGQWADKTDGWVNKKGTCSAFIPTANFYAKWSMSLSGGVEPDLSSKTTDKSTGNSYCNYNLGVTLTNTVGLGAAITFQVYLGPFPFFFTAGLDLSASLPLAIAFKANSVAYGASFFRGDFWHKLEFDKSKIVSFSIDLAIDLGLGFGYDGVAAVSFRWQHKFNETISLSTLTQSGSWKSECVLQGQIALFTVKAKIDAWTLKKSWPEEEKPHALSADDDGLPTLESMTPQELDGLTAATLYVEDVEASSNGDVIEPVLTDAMLLALDGDEEAKSSSFALTNFLEPDEDGYIDLSQCEEFDGVALTYGDAVGLASDGDATNPYTLNDHSTEANESGMQGTSSIAGIDANGNVTPNNVNKIFQSVYSDSRIKILGLKGTSYMFRIVSVAVADNEVRTRVVWQRYEYEDDAKTKGKWGDVHPVDFSSRYTYGISRTEFYDYEFDVKEIADDAVVLCITSGTRNADDCMSKVLSNTVANIVLMQRLDEAEAHLKAGDLKSLGCHTFGSNDKSGDFFAYSQPQIVDRTGDSKAAWEYLTATADGYCALITFRLSRASEQIDLITNGAHTSGLGVAFFQYTPGEEGAAVKVKPMILSMSTDDVTPTAFVLGNLKRESNGNVTLPVGYETNGSGCGVNTLTIIPNDSGQFTAAGLQLKSSLSLDAGESILKLQHWKGYDSFFAAEVQDEETEQDASERHESDKGKTKPVILTWSNGEAQTTAIGPSGYGASATVAPNARFIYSITNHNGAFGEDENGNDVEDNASYIMAMAFVDGVFTKPFVFCKIDDVYLDQLICAESTSETATYLPVDEGETILLGMHITDIENALGDIYDIRVPLVQGATALEVSSVTGFVVPGEDNKFYVTVRNDGNTVLTKADFEIVEVNGEGDDATEISLGKVSVDFSDEKQRALNNMNIVEYDTDSMDEDAKNSDIVKDEGASVLVPGSEGTYAVSIAIPARWTSEARESGKKTIRAKVITDSSSYIDPSMGSASISSLSDAAGYDPSTSDTSVDVNTTIAFTGEDLLPADLDFSKKSKDDTDDKGDNNGGDINGGDSGNGANGSNGSASGNSGSASKGKGTSSSVLPRTGDSALGAGLGVVGAAAVALGAGMTAYSRRRAEVEREARAAEGASFEQERIDEDDE